LNICLVSGEYPSEKAGGVASVVREIKIELEKRGVNYEIICTKDFMFNGNGRFLGAYGIHPFYDVTFGLNFKNYLKKEKDNWDLFNFHLPCALGPMLYSKSIYEKSVVTVHTTNIGYQNNLFKKMPLKYLSLSEKLQKLGYIEVPIFLEKKALKNAHDVIAVSSGVKQELEMWYGLTNVSLIPKGIDTTKLLSHAQSNKKVIQVLYVGRLVGQKGLFSGIEALSRIQASIKLIVIGSGYLRQELERFCERKCVDASFLGYIPEQDLFRYYSESDFLLMPSFYETEPLVAMEAAGSGLPIIAFEGANVNDIVCEENRRLIGQTGNIDQLVQSMRYLIDNDSERKLIGKKNRKRILDYYSAEAMAKSYVDEFQRLIG
jgi:glycosyltransferase involved in cell wall biosynthesis